MILADTSIWIELLNGRLPKGIAIDDLPLRMVTSYLQLLRRRYHGQIGRASCRERV